MNVTSSLLSQAGVFVKAQILLVLFCWPSLVAAQSCEEITRTSPPFGSFFGGSYQFSELESISSIVNDNLSFLCSASFNGNVVSTRGFGGCRNAVITVRGIPAGCDLGGGDGGETDGGETDSGETGGGETGGGETDGGETDGGGTDGGGTDGGGTDGGDGGDDGSITFPVNDELAQAPLFLTQAAVPNVMFILDDSGSMHFEIMPGSEIKDGWTLEYDRDREGRIVKVYAATNYLFPRANSVYGDGDYSNLVPIVEDKDSENNEGLSAFGLRVRSPQINSLYYDPGTTYVPWVKSDGESYPDAETDCAYHNPEHTGGDSEAYCRNLKEYNDNYNSVVWVDCGEDENRGECSSTDENREFWPATYYWFNGLEGGSWGRNNYTKVEIRPGLSFSGHGRDNRADCMAGTCTYDQEIQNFANWYTYYRSRVLTARAGVGFAFSTQSAGMRVGFGSLNQGESDVDGVDTDVLVNGVRAFEGEARDNFYKSLYERPIPNAGTPLREALEAAGQYFSRTDNSGPWGANPGTNDDSDHLECRRNFTVLMTDGYWSSGDFSGDGDGNNDGTDSNETHRRPVGDSYSYEAGPPFEDDYSNTLADVAMHFWQTDLRSDLKNLLIETTKNNAFWQHMVTYGVGFGVTGNIDPATAFAAIPTETTIAWPDPEKGEENKIDDLLHAGVNSRGGFFSAADPYEFAVELAGFLQEISNEAKASASSIAANSTRLDSGTLIYQASFSTEDWSGRLQAYSLNDDGTIDEVEWDTNLDTIPAHGSRQIYAGTGEYNATTTTAVAFTEANWDQLSEGQRSSLKDGSNVAHGKDVLNWLRGDDSDEGGKFRERDEVLGDIVNSDPFFVGSAENYGFDKLPGVEGSSYPAFLTAKESRTEMLYVGANDGMLHGFNAATGAEVFAYVPLSVFPILPDLTDPDYEHHYYVDGSPQALDVYLNGSWKTVLVGSTGAGADSVFALDVTDPSLLGASSLMWEFATAADANDRLGYATSDPIIARVNAGDKWVAIFSNGYASEDTVQLFVVDLATGELLKAIDTEISSENNAMATPVAVDADDDRIADYVYAGDLQGNLWKFDFTGDAIDDWDIAFYDSGTPVPLFNAVDEDGNAQPITAKPTAGDHPEGGLMVYFGTGKYFENLDAFVEVNPQVQDFYGIRDNGARVASKGDLVSQTVVFEGPGVLSTGGTTASSVRVISENGADSPPQYGWHLILQSPNNGAEGERSVSRAVLRNGRVIFTTIIPSETICGYGGRSWLMEVDAINGGIYPSEVLDINGDGVVDELDQVLVGDEYYPVSGIGTDELIKTPGIIDAGDLEYKYTSGSSGSITRFVEPGSGAARFGRQSWRQLR